MDNIYFSVIMPNYNKADYIGTSIKSVLTQEYSNFELIIVDDGSTDDSVRIIKSFMDRRIRLIRQTNSGAAVARNNGIKNAKYDYIAFLDSDDIWLPHFLEKMRRLIISFPDAEAYSCAFSREQVANKEMCYPTIDINASNDYILNDYFYASLYGSESMTASTTVLKKSAIEKCGLFPLGLSTWEDFDMWIRVALYCEVCYTDCICAIYNDVPNSASRNKAGLHAPVFDNYKYHIRKSGITGSKRKSFKQLVAQKEGHAAYEQYSVDHDRMKALKRVLPYMFIRFKDKTFWSSIIQFMITPERFFRLISK